MTSQLDVLFVIPADLVRVYQALAKEHATEPPAKARFMASYLLRRNVSVALLDSSVMGLDPSAMAEKVREMNPRLVVLPVYGFNPSSSTHTMPAARLFANAIKCANPEIPILMTGTHPAALPAGTLLSEAVDYVCAGEGPITVYELLQAIKAGGEIADIRKVRSLWYEDNKVVVHNAPAPLIDLNSEPVSIEAWRLMDPRTYTAHEWHTGWLDYANRSPYANPYSREGCPFSCGFCNIQSPFREGESLQLRTDINSQRTLRPEIFVEEITYLVEEFGTRWFKIPDEMFGLGNHPFKVAELIRERFGDSLTFWAYFRIDTCRPEHLDLLRSAGFRWLAIGIEAANSTVRSGQDKKFSDDYVYKIVERVKTAGIGPALNYIFGLPGDTMASMEETYAMAAALNSPFANFYCNQALPGSAQYEEALRAGYLLPERTGGPGWIGHAQYSVESEPFFMGDALTPAQIHAFRAWAHASDDARSEYRTMLLSQYGEVALRTQDELALRERSLTRTLLGSRSFWELSEQERAGLVPASVTMEQK